jgi:hypothetical protein
MLTARFAHCAAAAHDLQSQGEARTLDALLAGMLSSKTPEGRPPPQMRAT